MSGLNSHLSPSFCEIHILIWLEKQLMAVAELVEQHCLLLGHGPMLPFLPFKPDRSL